MLKQIVLDSLVNNKQLCNSLCQHFCQEYPQLSMYIIDKYNLTLLLDVYFNQINPRTFSGIKRKVLREQSVTFCKMMHFLNELAILQSDYSFNSDLYNSLLMDEQLSTLISDSFKHH